MEHVTNEQMLEITGVLLVLGIDLVKRNFSMYILRGVIRGTFCEYWKTKLMADEQESRKWVTWMEGM